VAIKPNVLIVDDDEGVRSFLSKALSRQGYPVNTASDGKEVLHLLKRETFQIVLLDLNLPKISGVELLKVIKKEYPQTEIIVISGHGTMRTALDSLKMGAYDYLHKPFEIDDLITTVERVTEYLTLSSRCQMMQERLSSSIEIPNLIVESPNMKVVLDLIQKVAPTDSNILIEGETGVGKEVVAKHIHKRSKRSEESFVTVHCAALPDTLIESELFGYEKGAFTDATDLKYGLLEIGDKGTVFLDEIGDLSANLQAKILRVVETKKFRRLGGSKEIEVDVRIISATNKNLSEEVNAHRFRDDLFYRLVVMRVEIPPLRARKEEIPQLVEYFLGKCAVSGKREKSILPEALELLKKYDWPGNIRELRNIIEQAIILSEKEIIEVEDLPLPVQKFNLTKEISEKTPTLLEVEKRYIKKVLQENQGNRGKVARILGISPRSLYYKIKHYGIQT
jgi:DNA-binding NtrC family response regulator